MSLESLIAAKALSKDSDDFLLNRLESLSNKFERLIEVQPEPFIFLKSVRDNLSSNFANDVPILKGSRVKDGHRATVKDFNLHFSTVLGTVKIVILDENDQIVQDSVKTITSDTNGIGETVLEGGERLAVVGQVAGAGKFSVFCSGQTQKVLF